MANVLFRVGPSHNGRRMNFRAGSMPRPIAVTAIKHVHTAKGDLITFPGNASDGNHRIIAHVRVELRRQTVSPPEVAPCVEVLVDWREKEHPLPFDLEVAGSMLPCVTPHIPFSQ